MRFLWKLVKVLFLLVVIVILAAGLYAGNVAYTELFHAPWDQILGITNRSKQLSSIRRAEARYGWDHVRVTSDDGTELVGTYIEDAHHSRRAVVLLHGLYQNRSMCLPYVDMYRQMGYNVLLADLRGHGESGGERTDWGVHDIGDMDSWVDFLKSKNPDMEIGFHGVSLGAAMALLYAGSDHGKEAAFYVADSSYGNLMELGREKLLAYTEGTPASEAGPPPSLFQRQGGSWLILGVEVLNPFFQAALFLHDGKLLCQLDPLYTVKHMESPVLFLHGAADTLVPPETAEELLRACSSGNKSLYVFRGAAHTMELATNEEAYREHVQRFLRGTMGE